MHSEESATSCGACSLSEYHPSHVCERHHQGQGSHRHRPRGRGRDVKVVDVQERQKSLVASTLESLVLDDEVVDSLLDETRRLVNHLGLLVVDYW